MTDQPDSEATGTTPASESERPPVGRAPHDAPKVVVVMPGRNVARTLKNTFDDIPLEEVHDVILADNASGDDTVRIARELGLGVIEHPTDRGYGGSQKSLYEEALRMGADIVIMIHPDHQYTPRVIPQLVAPIAKGEADAVFGSRMMNGTPLSGGMPRWKYVANILLTALANITFYHYLTEYHSGLRAYSRKYLESVHFQANTNAYYFDTEIIAQAVIHDLKILEIPIPTRYFENVRGVNFFQSCLYGLGILKTLARFKLHVWGVVRSSFLE